MLDNGSKMARFKKLESATGMEYIFLCGQFAWQCGVAENDNALLWQYLPRETNFHKITGKRPFKQ